MAELEGGPAPYQMEGIVRALQTDTLREILKKYGLEHNDALLRDLTDVVVHEWEKASEALERVKKQT